MCNEYRLLFEKRPLRAAGLSNPAVPNPKMTNTQNREKPTAICLKNGPLRAAGLSNPAVPVLKRRAFIDCR
jgi:hypothetical protein